MSSSRRRGARGDSAAQRESAGGNKRLRNTEQAMGDDETPYYYDTVRVTGQDLPAVDDNFNKRLKSLDKANALDDPIPETPELHKMSAKARTGFFRVVNQWAALNEKRIVRPSNPDDQAALRRLEAQTFGESGSAIDVTLLKTRSVNPFYASQTAPGWQEHGKAHMLASLWSNNVSVEHKHDISETLLLDVRICNRSGNILALPSPDEQLADEFKFTMLSPRDRVTLQHGSKYRAFAGFVEALDRRIDSSQAQTLGAVLDYVTRESGLSPHAVVLRHGDVLELALNIDIEARYFGVLAFTFANASEHTVSVAQRTQDELSRVRADDLEKFLAPHVTLGKQMEPALGKEVIEEQLDEMRKSMALSYKRFSNPVPDNATRVERLIARSTSMMIFEPRKSKELTDLLVCYQYGYMCTCQCLVDDDDLDAYKRAYGRFSRHLNSSEIPRFDSDVEDEPGSTASTEATSSTAAATSNAPSSINDSRYTSSRDRQLQTAGGDREVVSANEVVSSVPLTAPTLHERDRSFN